MKKYTINIVLFVFIGLIFGETIVRMFHLTSDIPKRVIDSSGIQKYYPDQEGYWLGGGHKWHINSAGWPGPLPDSMDNLVTVIGDSFIENFMNPDSCHQANYLKQFTPEYNYLEVARSGVSLIESLELAKSLDSLNPKHQLIYVGDNDFYESISQLGRKRDITQIDLEKGIILPGVIKTPRLKLILYNWKFLYYLYNRFHSNSSVAEPLIPERKVNPELLKKRHSHSVELVNYLKNNYNTQNILIVFRPETDSFLIGAARRAGFATVTLIRNEKEEWSFEHDPHWTCFGHKQAASQVAEHLPPL